MPHSLFALTNQRRVDVSYSLANKSSLSNKNVTLIHDASKYILYTRKFNTNFSHPAVLNQNNLCEFTFTTRIHNDRTQIKYVILYSKPV